MAVKEIVAITDHIAQAIDRLPQQFKELEGNYPTLDNAEANYSGWEAFLTAFVNPAQEFEYLCKKMLVSLDITVATGSSLDKIGSLVGKSRTDVDDDVYRKDIFIQIGSNTSEGTYEDITDLYGLYGLEYFRYLEPAPASFYFNLGVVDRNDLIPINNMTAVAKAAGVAYQMSGVLSDPSNPIPKDQPLFVFKNGGEGESFGVLQEDEETIVGGGRYSLLLSDTNYVPPSGDEELAVGTIQMSTLDETQFTTAMGADAVKWVLADGRSVSGSEYTRITANESVPDMSGLFTVMPENQNAIGDISSSLLNAANLSATIQVGNTGVSLSGASISVAGNKNQLNLSSSSVSSVTLNPTLPVGAFWNPYDNPDFPVGLDNTKEAIVQSTLYSGDYPPPAGWTGVSSNANNDDYYINAPVANHRHGFSGTFSLSGTTNTGSAIKTTSTRVSTSDVQGGASETRPTNVALNYFIKIDN